MNMKWMDLMFSEYPQQYKMKTDHRGQSPCEVQGLTPQT